MSLSCIPKRKTGQITLKRTHQLKFRCHRKTSQIRCPISRQICAIWLVFWDNSNWLARAWTKHPFRNVWIINECSQCSLCRQGHKFGNIACSACFLVLSLFFLFEKYKKFIKWLSHHWFSPGGKLFNLCLLRGIACPFLSLAKESVYTSV